MCVCVWQTICFKESMPQIQGWFNIMKGRELNIEHQGRTASHSLLLFVPFIRWLIVAVDGRGGSSWTSPSVLAAVAEQFYHVREEKTPHLHQLSAGCRVFQQRGHHLQNHWDTMTVNTGSKTQGNLNTTLLSMVMMRFWAHNMHVQIHNSWLSDSDLSLRASLFPHRNVIHYT